MRKIALLICLLSSLAALGQKKGSPSDSSGTLFRVSINVVSVDVVATDKSGKRISDLKPEEITVFEDGKERPLKGLTLVAAEGTAAPTQLYSQEIKDRLAKLPPNVVTNLSAMPSLLQQPVCTVLLIDALNTPNNVRQQARMKLIEMLDDIDLNEPVAVYGLGSSLMMLQDFTTDRSLLKKAIAEAKSAKPAGSVGSNGQMIDTTGSDWIDQATDWQQKDIVDRIRTLEFWEAAVQLNMRIINTSNALQAIARRLEGVPGRKNLVWATGMFPEVLLPDPELNPRAWLGVGPGSSVSSDAASLMTATALQLESAHVAVYPVDASGLQNRTFGIDSDKHSDNLFTKYQPGTMGSSAESSAIESGERHSAMDRIATLTGGRAFYNRNDLGKAVSLAVNDGDSYYALTFAPAEQSADGRVHAIKLNTTRKGVVLNYRRSFFAYDPSRRGPEQTKFFDEAFRQAVNTQRAPSTGVIIYSKFSATKKNVVELMLDPRSITLAGTDNGTQRVRLDVVAVPFDRGGHFLQPTAQIIDFQVNEEQSKQLAAHGLRYEIAYNPSESAKRVRIGVRDMNSGRIGTVDLKLE